MMRIMGMWKITEMRVVRKNRKDGCENYLSVVSKVAEGWEGAYE